MSAPDLAGLVEVLPISRSDTEGDDGGTVVAYANLAADDPDDPIQLAPDEKESTGLNWWQHYGFLSRPPAGSEALVMRIGAQAFAIASRALAASGMFGKMSDGDVAMFSVGGNVIRVNANRSISVLVPTDNGKQMVARFDPKKGGSFKMLTGDGLAMEFSKENGFVVNAGTANITFATQGTFQVNAQGGLLNNSPTFKSWMGATKPMVAANNTAASVFI